MKRILTLTFVIALAVAAAPLAAQTSPSQPSLPAGQPVPWTAPALLTLATPAESPATGALPNDLNGALFVDNWECEQACYDDYLQCANGCSACDQCSCQLAYCRVNCGVPFTGC
jgi:hypothetical protein